jgi:hypothetical protein
MGITAFFFAASWVPAEIYEGAFRIKGNLYKPARFPFFAIPVKWGIMGKSNCAEDKYG